MRTYIIPDNLIDLGEGYSFSADDMCYTLYHTVKRKKKDIKTKREIDEMIESTDVVGYYFSLRELIKACVEYEIKQGVKSGATKTLRECIDRIESFENYLKQITKDY